MISTFTARQMFSSNYTAKTPQLKRRMKADALLEAGYIDGQAVWKRILVVVDELLLEARPRGAGVN